MTTLLDWLRRLALDDVEADAGRGGADRGLTVWLSAGADAEPAPADLQLEAGSGERAEAMLRELLRLGTVARVWLALSPAVSDGAERRLRRLARRARTLGVRVERAGEP